MSKVQALKLQNIIIGLIALWLITASVGYFYFPYPHLLTNAKSEFIDSAWKLTSQLADKNLDALIDCTVNHHSCIKKIVNGANLFTINTGDFSPRNAIKFIAILDANNLILQHSDSAFVNQNFIAISHPETVEAEKGIKYIVGRTTDKTLVIAFFKDVIYFGKKIGEVHLALFESSINDLIDKFNMRMAWIGLTPLSILTVIWIIIFLNRMHAKGKAQRSQTFTKGDKIGIYTVIKTIKQTTNAELYLAKDNFGRRFVIKIPSRKISIDLQHTNIVGIKDFYKEKEILVMEYIRGKDLADIIKLAPQLPINQVIFIISKIANGLRYAHTKGSFDQDTDTKGIIHRDIKPGNIMISYEGDVKISDFGIAKDEKDPQTTIHATGTIIVLLC